MTAAADVDVRLGGEPCALLPERAVYWPRRRWLIVADAHFGKAATFRARGIPVPRGTTGETLARLEALLARTQAHAIVFLGDLFHAAEAHAPGAVDEVSAWRSLHRDVEWILIEGNHDRAAGAPPSALRLRVEREPWQIDALAFCHYPRPVAGAHVLAGHLHPAVRIHGRADDSIRAPCFWLRPQMTVLPAFGSFTGGAPFDRAADDRVYAVADGRLFAVPSLRDAA